MTNFKVEEKGYYRNKKGEIIELVHIERKMIYESMESSILSGKPFISALGIRIPEKYDRFGKVVGSTSDEGDLIEYLGKKYD
jgi:hypothetical protein